MKTSLMWTSIPNDVESRLDRCLDNAKGRTIGPIKVFFRADDIGVPGNQYSTLMAIFTKHRIPLNLAVVPFWLTQTRWEVIRQFGDAEQRGKWCWHQHGYRHRNHEKQGKKQEFGPARSTLAIQRDLLAGRRRLEKIMGSAFFPAFTPPWNRCSGVTENLLQQLGYRLVSKREEAARSSLGCLKERSINVDLHTMKVARAAEGWHRLFGDIKTAFSNGGCGFMIHHQRMNSAAFGFLDLLLGKLNRWECFTTDSFKDMINDGRTR
jgi:hypothetical protein